MYSIECIKFWWTFQRCSHFPPVRFCSYLAFCKAYPVSQFGIVATVLRHFVTNVCNFRIEKNFGSSSCRYVRLYVYYRNETSPMLLYQHTNIQYFDWHWRKCHYSCIFIVDSYKFVQFLTERKLGWTADYSTEKFLPVLTRWYLKNGSNDSKVVELECVIKKRILRNVPSYEVKWRDFNPTTVEPMCILKLKFHHDIELFERTKASAKLKKSKDFAWYHHLFLTWRKLNSTWSYLFIRLCKEKNQDRNRNGWCYRWTKLLIVGNLTGCGGFRWQITWGQPNCFRLRMQRSWPFRIIFDSRIYYERPLVFQVTKMKLFLCYYICRYDTSNWNIL